MTQNENGRRFVGRPLFENKTEELSAVRGRGFQLLQYG
jgi:hypothetical protein